MEQYVLHVTHKCNLRCRYCYEKDRDTTYSQEEIKATCREIMKCKEQYRVEFIGGEPLLAWDHIKFAYDFIRSRVTLCQGFTISTNLFTLSEEQIEWLRLNRDVDVSVSLDGGRYANQLRVTKGGKGTYETVVANIKRLLQEIGSDRCRVHATATPYNVGLIAHSVDHLYNLGVRRVAYGIIESSYLIDQQFALRYLKEMNEVSKKRKAGVYPGLFVSEQDNLKPPSDKRTYVYDSEGKPIFESYGRATEDAITQGEVNAEEVSGHSTELIKSIRQRCYENHQYRTQHMKLGKLVEGHKVEGVTVTLKKLKPLGEEGLSLKVTPVAPHVFIADEDGLNSGAQGKGWSEEMAKVSCLAEYVERTFMSPGHSNGVAAGNTKEEAILQAASEIFERYYMFQSVTSDGRYPTIIPETITNYRISELYFWLLNNGYSVTIKQLSELMPTYGVFFENMKKPMDDPTRYSYTVGACFDSDVAIMRALMEKFQILLDTEGVVLNNDKPLLDMLENGRSLWDFTHLKEGPAIDYVNRYTLDLAEDACELSAILSMWDRDITVEHIETPWLPVCRVRIEGMMNMFKEEL